MLEARLASAAAAVAVDVVIVARIDDISGMPIPVVLCMPLRTLTYTRKYYTDHGPVYSVNQKK